MGVAPEQLARQLAESGQLSFAAAEVLRGKAMNLIAERVKVTDESGHEVDIKAALNAPAQADEAAEGAVAADDDAEVMAETDSGADAEASTADDGATEDSAVEDSAVQDTAEA
jgi:trigger factor